MNIHGIATVVVVAGLLILPVLGITGPLDRGPMQERDNPAAKDMLRVPGVVGSYEQEALGSLQQAGLSVNVKRITKDDPKYEGKEGTVISQVPSAGGVAMVGSSVSITVYKTGQGYQHEGGGYGDQEGDGTWQNDGQQGGADQPDGQDQWNSGNDSGGWQPPQQGEDMEEPDSNGNPDIGVDRGGLHMPQPSGGMRTPHPRMPVGKHDGGAIGARSGMPSKGRLEPGVANHHVITPAQKRELDRNFRGSRGENAEGGTIHASPVQPTATAQPPRLRATHPTASKSVPLPVARKTDPLMGKNKADMQRTVQIPSKLKKPVLGHGSRGIIVGTAKPKPTGKSGGAGIIVGTAKPKPVAKGLQTGQQLRNTNQQETKPKSWLQKLFH